MARVRTLIALGLASICLLTTHPSLGQGPPSDDLTVGRQLFAEALEDEDHRRFDAALEKYRRVVQIRDTAPIRYRMGVTLEALGRTTEALESYAAAVRLGAAGSDSDAEVVRASQARIDALEPKVAHLAIRLAPDERESDIRVDGRPIPAAELDDVRLDAGRHVVEVAGSGQRTSRVEVTLSEGGRAEIPIVLERPPPPPPPPERSSLRTVGIVTGAAGGVLLVGGLVALALRSGAISDLEEACPQGNCPISRENELRSTRDRALVMGPVGGALIGAGVLALGAGVVLFSIGGKDAKSATGLAPTATRSGMMLTLTRTF